MILRKFRLYPDCHWVYFQVVIYDTHEAMNKATGQPENVRGLCKGWLIGHVPSGKIKPKIGEIHLYSKQPGIGVSSHEICHAVHRYFWVRKELGLGYGKVGHRRDPALASHKEEAFCWVLGEMIRQFCIAFHERKIDRRPTLKRLKQTFNPIEKTMLCRSFQ